MNGKYLLDTSVIIDLFGDDAAIRARLGQAPEIFVPSIAIGELSYGARKSARPQQNLAQVDEFVMNSIVLAADVETARHYGEIKTALRLKGRPLPENDIWIAAIASQHSLTLASRDAHFSAVENLRVETW